MLKYTEQVNEKERIPLDLAATQRRVSLQASIHLANSLKPTIQRTLTAMETHVEKGMSGMKDFSRRCLSQP